MTEPQRDPIARDRELGALVGSTVAGKYQVTRLIGRGGMGAVYEAEHLGIGRKVALKFVDHDHAKDDAVVSRFAREARAASAIESEHIVSVFDAGSEDGRPFLVMELLRGEDVGARLRRLRKLAQAEAVHIVAQLLRGLSRAHGAGIVHRDLKPDNVLLVEREGDPLFVKIVDFGISKVQRLGDNTAPLPITLQGMVLGTPLYMSPEQARASPDVDERGDLYSVGAILFECLTGRPPHVGESEEQVIVSICTTEAPDVRSFEPTTSEALAHFVRRSLARQREHRFQTAKQMLAALHEVAPDEPATMATPSLRETVVDSHPAGLAAAEGRDAASGPTLALGGGVGLLADDAPRVSQPSSVPTGPPTKVSWSSGGRPRAALLPETGRGPVSRASLVIAAALATLTGGIVTLWIGTAMRQPAPSSSALAGYAASAGATVARGPVDPPVATVAPSATAPTAPIVLAPAKPQLAGTPPPRTAPAGARGKSAAPDKPQAPRGSSLDISRELP